MLSLQHTCRVRVVNQAGLHARPCHAIVSTAQAFRSELRVQFEGRDINGKSILELMTLTAAAGAELKLSARGADAEALLTRLTELFASGFGEELDNRFAGGSGQ
jgi:phosphotransferase system HPr (HPr) family protein